MSPAWQDGRVLPADDPTAATSRRRVLLTLTGLLAAPALTGCSVFGGADERPTVNPLAAVIESTATLANTYDAAVSAHPDLVGELTPIRDAHRAHLNALATATDSPVPSSAPAGAPAGDRASVLAELAGLEKTARDAAVAACLSAPARYATVLGTLAAARSAHLEVLK
jgi:hypothetical protein